MPRRGYTSESNTKASEVSWTPATKPNSYGETNGNIPKTLGKLQSNMSSKTGGALNPVPQVSQISFENTLMSATLRSVHPRRGYMSFEQQIGLQLGILSQDAKPTRTTYLWECACRLRIGKLQDTALVAAPAARRREAPHSVARTFSADERWATQPGIRNALALCFGPITHQDG